MQQSARKSFTSYLILTLAFISGFIIMTIELLGGRILSPWFGNSIHVWGSIITVFMLSLSLGYLYGGRLKCLGAKLRVDMQDVGKNAANLPTGVEFFKVQGGGLTGLTHRLVHAANGLSGRATRAQCERHHHTGCQALSQVKARS